MTKTNKIYLTFRSNLTKIVSFCTFLLILFFGLLWVLTNGSVDILSINQNISCQKFLSTQNFLASIQNNSWYPQLRLIKVFGVDLKRTSKIKYTIQKPNLVSKLLNTLQAFGYLDEKEAYLVPVFISGKQSATININQSQAIRTSVQCPIITLYGDQDQPIKRSIQLNLDNSYKNHLITPKLNSTNLLNSTYQDDNQFTIKIKWQYTQYFNVSNFMG